MKKNYSITFIFENDFAIDFENLNCDTAFNLFICLKGVADCRKCGDIVTIYKDGTLIDTTNNE